MAVGLGTFSNVLLYETAARRIVRAIMTLGTGMGETY